jgi:hypothetical protein
MYHSLIVNTHLAASIIFGLAVLYLLAGLISPSLARASGRGAVVLRSIFGIFLAIGLAVGVIVYTHMQPDGPHSMETYLKDYDWQQHKSEGAPSTPTPETPTAPAATEP